MKRILSDEEINEIIITHMDDYSSNMLDLAKAIEKAAIAKIIRSNDEHLLSYMPKDNCPDKSE